MRKERERAERRRRTLISGSIIVAAALIVGVGAFAVKKANDHRAATSTAEGSNDKINTPAGNIRDGITIPVSKGHTLAKNAPKVELFEDFLCPACESFETQNRSQLQSMAADGTIKLVYYPLAILDYNSAVDRKHYSSRSASAAICAFEAGGASAFEKAHNTLYANQPSETGPTFPTNAKLVKTFTAAGLTGFDTCIEQSKYAGFVRRVMTGINNRGNASSDAKSSVVSKRGITYTPTLKINGKTVEASTAAQVKAAITKAAK